MGTATGRSGSGKLDMRAIFAWRFAAWLPAGAAAFFGAVGLSSSHHAATPLRQWPWGLEKKKITTTRMDRGR